MKYIVFVAYYLFVVFLICGTAYIVFWKNFSGWWFVLTILFSQISPEIKTKEKD